MINFIDQIMKFSINISSNIREHILFVMFQIWTLIVDETLLRATSLGGLQTSNGVRG